MRGFGTGSDHWPKSDKIQANYTSQNAPAFRPPKPPVQLPLEGAAKTSDEKLLRRQKTYSAPAHAISSHLDAMKAQALVPLEQAAAASNDPGVVALISQASTYLQKTAATTLGYAVRSLASSYNSLAVERREALMKVQAADVKAALADVRPGFDSFFGGDISCALITATQAAQLRMAQTALARMAPRGRHHNSGNGNGNGNGNNNRRSNGGFSGGGRRRGGSNQTGGFRQGRGRRQENTRNEGSENRRPFSNTNQRRRPGRGGKKNADRK